MFLGKLIFSGSSISLYASMAGGEVVCAQHHNGLRWDLPLPLPLPPLPKQKGLWCISSKWEAFSLLSPSLQGNILGLVSLWPFLCGPVSIQEPSSAVCIVQGELATPRPEDEKKWRKKLFHSYKSPWSSWARSGWGMKSCKLPLSF